MTNKEYADSLRELADWWEKHKEIEAPSEYSSLDYCHLMSKEQAILTAHALGLCKKEHEDTTFCLNKDFEKLRVRFIFWRSAVCRKKVVGEKDVPEKITPAHKEEIIEWECDPILADNSVRP